MGSTATARPFRVDVRAAAACQIAWLPALLRCQQLQELGAAEQFQEALKLASMGGGGVEVEGKSASIKSISDSIQSSMACCLSSNSSFLSSSFSRLSLSGSRRQLSIDKNERKRESDEPDAPLLLEGEDVAGEVDVVIGGEERNEGNHKASASFKHSWRVDREAARPGLHRRIGHQSRNPERRFKILVRLHWCGQAATTRRP